MPRLLPPSPSLEQLHKQAKDLSKARKAGDASVCAVLRHIPALAKVPDEQILATDVPLQDVQHALAREYGFVGWSQLKHHVESMGGGDRPITAPVPVARQNGRVWIEPFEELRWDWTQTNSTLRCWAIIYQTLGLDITYADLMGVTGMAFRLQLHEQWCGSSPHLICGWRGGENLLIQASPFQIVGIGVRADDPESVETARQRIRDSIDRGIPVITSSEEDGLIVAYEDEGRMLIWHNYFKMGRPQWERMDKWPWGVGLLERRPIPPDRPACYRASLQAAVNLWSTARFGDYHSGQAAYEKWVRELREEDRFAALDEKALRRLAHNNAHIYESLYRARRCAVEYLDRITDAFGPEQQADLRRARELYAEVAALLGGADRPTVVAPYPHNWKPGETWTQEQRLRQASNLEQAQRLEVQAVETLRHLLTQ